MPRKRGREQANANSARHQKDVGDKMSKEDLLYIGSALAALGLWACALGLLYVVVEGAWWLYSKATGREY
jgi:hypothetical protein